MMTVMYCIVLGPRFLDTAWPSNEELRWISRHLTKHSMTKICKALKVTCKTEDYNIEEKRYICLREWRNKVAHEPIWKKHELLSSAIGSKNLRGLLPPLKGRFIYKAELVDTAFNLSMSDLLPVSEAMGIKVTKLVLYRPAFEPFHLKIGTIDLLSKLLRFSDGNRYALNLINADVRNVFNNTIGKFAYRNIATCGMVAYDMSYGELHAISKAMTSSKQKGSIRQVPDTMDDKFEVDAAPDISEDGNMKSEAMGEKADIHEVMGDTSEQASRTDDDKCEEDDVSTIHGDVLRKSTETIVDNVGVTLDGKSKTPARSKMNKNEESVPSKQTVEKDKTMPVSPVASISQGDKPSLQEGTHSKHDSEEHENMERSAESLQSEPLLMMSHQTSEPNNARKQTMPIDQRTEMQVSKIPEELVMLQKVLQLTDEDVAEGLGSSHSITTHILFRIWKEMPRPSVFNYRAALAHGLRKIDMTDLADGVISGKYIGEHTSLEFIKNMVRGLVHEQRKSLGKLLGLSGKDEQWHINTSSEVISKQVDAWVAKWTKEVKTTQILPKEVKKALETFKETVPGATKPEKHRNLNDKLVEHGFLELAREIMIIEQQLG